MSLLMKSQFLASIIALALFCASMSSFAQGALNFANFGGGVDAPVTDWKGNLLNGPGFVADLYWAKGTVANSTLLTPLNQSAPFWTNGYFTGGERIIPGTTNGDAITAQIRVWDLPTGGFIYAGQSVLFLVTLTSTPSPPATIGLGSHSFTADTPCLGCPPPILEPPLRLNMDRNTLVLIWPTTPYSPDFQIQQNSDLNTTNWVTLTNRPVLVGQTNEIDYQISIPRPSVTTFYRLTR
jgi:hypothetical protein